MESLIKKLNESVDLYSPEQLPSKDIEYTIERDSSTRFRATLRYKDQYYILTVLPLFNPKRPSVNFGSTDKNHTTLDLNTLLNSPYSFRVLAAIFGLIRYWVDKYNIQQFEYTAEGSTRNKIYKYYLEKHFSDFENSQEQFNGATIEVWKKI